MLRWALISMAVVLMAWLAVRFWHLRGPLRRLGDGRQDEDALRAGAEAVLAARLARGEIDEATYARTMQVLWGFSLSDLEAAQRVPPETPPPQAVLEPAGALSALEPAASPTAPSAPAESAPAEPTTNPSAVQVELPLDPPPEPYL